MRVAALYDIHGNLPALEAVLAEVETAAPDLVLLGGDVVLGPMPSEVLDRLARVRREVAGIRGNCEREVLDAAGEEATWVAARLRPAQREQVASWPFSRRLLLDGRRVLFCHATPRSDQDQFTERSPQDRIRSLFGPPEADLVVCGHTHVQFERRLDFCTVVNAGSVGMPYEDQPGAYWLVLDERGHQLRRTPYDTDRAAEMADRCGYPGAWFAENLRRPPGREDAISEFERRIAQGSG